MSKLSVSFVRRHLRSLSLVAALSLSATGLLLGEHAASAATLKPNFKAFDATRYSENPNLAPYGLQVILVAYEDSIWPSGASKTNPNTSYIKNTYIPKIRSKNPSVVIIDIEVWRFKSDMTSSQRTANISKFKQVIAAFRSGLPNAKIGVYLHLPERNWLAPCGDPKKVSSRTSSWHQRNLQLQPLADAVDIIVPSLYTFYGDSAAIACWPKYAAANIKEARTYGKPVWAFLWMKYHTTGNWIPRTFWRTQLEQVYSLADGVVIWSRAKSDDRWSWSAPWWLETKDFLADKNLD